MINNDDTPQILGINGLPANTPPKIVGLSGMPINSSPAPMPPGAETATGIMIREQIAGQPPAKEKLQAMFGWSDEEAEEKYAKQMDAYEKGIRMFQAQVIVGNDAMMISSRPFSRTACDDPEVTTYMDALIELQEKATEMLVMRLNELKELNYGEHQEQAE